MNAERARGACGTTVNEARKTYCVGTSAVDMELGWTGEQWEICQSGTCGQVIH